MRRIYLWEAEAWPTLTWDEAIIAPALHQARAIQEEALKGLRAVGLGAREIAIDTLTTDIVNTSAIEGVVLDADAVQSSIVRRLGLGDEPGPRDEQADGLAELTLDATMNYRDTVTPERLFRWHSALFRADATASWAGRWRDDAGGAMQVISSSASVSVSPRVHYEAPPASRVPMEMQRLCDWVNEPVRREDGIVRSGIAHLWFLSIHPFEDGNGRIARALGDLLLARDEKSPRRFISVSQQVRASKRGYYDILEATQRGRGDITSWLGWYLEAYRAASDRAVNVIETTLKVRAYWQLHAGALINARQRAVLQQYLSESFQGFLNTAKYAKIAKVSVDTADRDLKELLRQGLVARNPGSGKNTSYDVVVNELTNRLSGLSLDR